MMVFWNRNWFLPF